MEYLSNEQDLFQEIKNLSQEFQEVKKICEIYDKIFGNFLAKFLNIFKVKLERVLSNFSENSEIILNKQNIINSALCDIAKDILNLCSRSLIIEITEKREMGLLVGEDSKSRYDYFENLLLDDNYVLEILNKYPVLANLLYRLIISRIELLSELINNLYKDYKSITREFGVKFKTVEDVIFSSGDTHNGGKKVLIVSTDNGKIVYKPHCLSPEKLFNQIIEFVNSTNILEYKLNSIVVIDLYDYGWQEYVEYKTCEASEEVSRYFYRIGAALAIFHILGCDDIHYENLIVNGEYPAFIDLETLFKNKLKDIDYNETLYTLFYKDVCESVLGTMLLPLNIQHSIFDYDLGGISKSAEETSNFWTSFIIEFEGTDNIQLVKGSGVAHSDTSNRVTLKNEMVEPIDFAEDIQRGFMDCYKLIFNNKEEFKKTVLSKNIEVRQVLRATSVYARFLEASIHPKYLKKIDDRYTLLSKLRIEKNENTEEFKNKNLSEINSLMNGDTPYFSTYLHTNDLVCDRKQVIPNFYESSLSEALSNRMDCLSESSLKKQMYYIRMSLSTSVRDVWKDRSIKASRMQAYFVNRKKYVECAKELGDLFCDNAVWNHNKLYCTWVTPTMTEDSRLKLAPLNFNLYEGGGLILFLLLLGNETKEEKYKSVALAAMKYIEDSIKLKPENNMSPSIFSGIGSLIYLHYSFYTINNDSESYFKYKTYIRRICEYQLDNGTILDVVGGVSGLIILLLNIYQKEKTQDIIDACKILGEHLYTRLEVDLSKELTGLSHGLSGYAWAMIYLGTVINNIEYIEFGKKLISIENKEFDSDRANWKDLRTEDNSADPVFWCHGAPGISISRINIKKILCESSNIIDSDLEKAIGKIIKDGFNEELDHSLCHGVFGNIDILLSLGRQMERNDLIDKAFEEADKVISYIATKGIRSGLKNGFDMSTFMLGLSGIGYALLRLNNQDLPSVLSLDI